MPVPDMGNGSGKDFNFGEAKSQLVKLVVVDKCDIIYNKVIFSIHLGSVQKL